MSNKHTSWTEYGVEFANTKQINDLSIDAQVLLNFLTLLVDIKYRNKYVVPFEETTVRVYSAPVQVTEVLAGQISPVEERLLGINRRELLGP